MIITVSGKVGSGKTTISKLFAKKLGYKHYSIGNMRGKMAFDMGLTINELNDIGLKEDWTDKEVDDYQKNLGEKKDNIVIDGRISYHLIPHAYNIFLEVDLDESARRIFSNQRPDEKHYNKIDILKQRIKARMKNSWQRYKKYYDIDLYDLSNYDLVIDTTNLTVQQVLEKILESLKPVLKQKKMKQ